MRDPDLVMRAERAAIALEQAWGRWRVMHGLDSGPLPPVTSYVGYSLEEPWGQPRVVFGVAAEEAERLAALLNGHDCVGPVHAEVSSRPDWRRTAPGGAGAVHDAPLRDSVGVPAQRQQPASDLLPPGRQADSAPIDKAPENRQVPLGGCLTRMPVSNRTHRSPLGRSCQGCSPQFPCSRCRPMTAPEPAKRDPRSTGRQRGRRTA